MNDEPVYRRAGYPNAAGTANALDLLADLEGHVALYHVEELVGRFVVVKRRLSAGRAMSLYQGQDT